MRKLLAAVAMLAVVGCGGTTTNPLTGPIEGEYRIQSVNGASLPWAVPGSPDNEIVTDDVLTLTDKGSWSEVYSYKANGSSTVQTLNVSGQIFRNGGNISLAEDRVTKYTGTFDGSQLHLVTFTGNAALVYKRQ